jgi:hypothetical protein
MGEALPIAPTGASCNAWQPSLVKHRTCRIVAAPGDSDWLRFHAVKTADFVASLQAPATACGFAGARPPDFDRINRMDRMISSFSFQPLAYSLSKCGLGNNCNYRENQPLAMPFIEGAFHRRMNILRNSN